MDEVRYPCTVVQISFFGRYSLNIVTHRSGRLLFAEFIRKPDSLVGPTMSAIQKTERESSRCLFLQLNVCKETGVESGVMRLLVHGVPVYTSVWCRQI